MKNYLYLNKIMMLTITILSISIALSSNSMLGMWISLEINLLSIIPIFMMGESKKTEKSLIMYFLVQSISSMIFLVTIMFSKMFVKWEELISMMLIISILIKLGLFPFHIWVLSVMEGLSWMSCLILSTIQKIIPLTIFFISSSKYMIIIMCIINSIFSSLSAINQFSMRKILGFSSINHLSFLIISSMISKWMMKIYFLFYSIMNFLIMKTFNLENWNYLYQIFIQKKTSFMSMLSVIFILLSMAGIPPLLGFFPKMFIFSFFIKNMFIISSSLILFSSVVSIFFYLRMTFKTLFFSIMSLKEKSKSWNSMFLWNSSMIFSPILFIWNFSLTKIINLQN